MVETSLVLVKPDGVQRGLIGEVISRLERKGLKLVGSKMLWMDEERASRHYEEHREKKFYGELVAFITSGPVLAMAWEGRNAIAEIRKMLGATDPLEALPGTIRGDLALFMSNNIVHASDGAESARRELKIFFDPEEIVNYERDISRWIGYKQ
ncbi:MAG: nucleoside-diphosphate kinase [Firmicutes bacterium]|jgi:nucleoside-diphosphate kinase|nr:nucleoside-diphosphate kinase [Bacillota bacterium]